MLGLGACGPAAKDGNGQAPSRQAVVNTSPSSSAGAPQVTPDVGATDGTGSQPMRAERLSCAADIGAAAAQRRVKVCIKVSPATHPPCNAANSCAMIEDEIARSCALMDGDASPMDGCTPAPKTTAAAVTVVQRYYSALNARDYDTAWQQWGEQGPPHQTRETFQAGFARTRSTRVTIGTLRPGDAGAGSIYQPVPVTVDATLIDGTHQRFTGDYTIRRVNDVDGATQEQLRWHIGAAHLSPAPLR